MPADGPTRVAGVLVRREGKRGNGPGDNEITERAGELSNGLEGAAWEVSGGGLEGTVTGLEATKIGAWAATGDRERLRLRGVDLFDEFDVRRCEG